NRCAVELRPLLERLMAAKREFDRLQDRIAVESLVQSGATPDPIETTEMARLQTRRTELAEQLSQGVQAVHRRGCLVKDIDRGLVDFYALSGDRLIFLCWHLGEAEVSHWHSLEAGYTSRQPLNHTEMD
ncbi:MAG: DUF2203 domain-containing protein, partial [Candidatus Eisenbacteria bacterium]